MWTKLKAIRINDYQVEITLSLNNIKDEYTTVAHEVIKIEDYYAVVFHIRNSNGSIMSHGNLKFSTKGVFDIPKNENDYLREIRVFYWNDNENDSLSSVLDCFKNAFNVFRLDENELPIGIFNIKKYCSSIIEPRQGGNGGVVGIESPTP